ncbi:MAG TPA: bifunctional riboflavin kinase/FAD synthetase [bacterium]|nr:bifunctional riboflavin kinase/FAD synthetase [bacterium]HQI48203.1 bifunctional riboflavin kinase/FAD synthetase [bacterium]HQJ64775.1 bifunctional riboflavin kinase/FAD synthetase [bacterium]
MQIIWNIHTFPPSDSSVVSLGTFDGVHRGHQSILTELKRRAERAPAHATMITFEPHPQLVLQDPTRPQQEVLTTIEEKIEILSGLGLDRLVIAHFSPAFASMVPDRFVIDILLNKLHMREIIIGHDHAFGKGRSGNLALLQKLGEDHGFAVDSLPPLKYGEEIISSTRIRQALQEGDLELATQMLGRPYSINGLVMHGAGRGTGLGFPTINLKPYSQYKLVPRPGIYASRSRLGGRRYDSVTYIGQRPTFPDGERVIETYIIDFNAQLYGQEVNVELIAYIREDARFATATALIEQIKQDVAKSMELLSSH